MEKNSPLKRGLWGRIFQTLIVWVVHILFRPKIIYADKTLKKRLRGRAVVFVANHTHHFDGAFAPAMMWRHKPYVLVKKSWFEKKGTGKAISWCRTIPIDLDGADASWYETAQEAVSAGYSLFIFPEGGLARNGQINEFKPGAALVSAKTGTPIVPCVLYGKYKMFVGMRMRIFLGEPIECKCPDDMRPSRYAAQVIKQAEAAVKEIYARAEEKYGVCGQYEIVDSE